MWRVREGAHSVAYAVGMVAVVAVMASLLSLPGRPVRFCQRVFAGLVDGNVSVRRAIAWEQLNALDMDVGATYGQLSDPAEQAAYQRAFIQNFAEGFRQSGATRQALTNWRRGPAGRVTAEYPDKRATVVFYLVGGLRMRLAGIQWQ